MGMEIFGVSATTDCMECSYLDAERKNKIEALALSMLDKEMEFGDSDVNHETVDGILKLAKHFYDELDRITVGDANADKEFEAEYDKSMKNIVEARAKLEKEEKVADFKNELDYRTRNIKFKDEQLAKDKKADERIDKLTEDLKNAISGIVTSVLKDNKEGK